MGIPIMTRETGNGIYCLKTLAMNIPIDEAEKAVRLSATFAFSILICKGTLWYLVASV